MERHLSPMVFKSSGSSPNKRRESRSPAKSRGRDPLPPSFSSPNHSVMNLKAKSAEQRSQELAQQRAELELAELFQQFKTVDDQIQKKCLLLDKEMTESMKKRDQALDEKYKEMETRLEEFTKKIKLSCEKNQNVVSKINESIRKAHEAEAARLKEEERIKLKAQAEAKAKLEAEARAKVEAAAKAQAEAVRVEAQRQETARAAAAATPSTTPSTPVKAVVTATLQPGEFPSRDFQDPRWIPFIQSTPKGKIWVVLSAFQEYCWFKDKYDSVAKCVEVVKVTPGLKEIISKLRGDIQNAVNALANSPEQVQQKIGMMNTLLAGTSQRQELYLSCLWILADRLIVQAAQQVAKNPDSALSFALLIQGVREAHPYFHYFMMGQFHQTCPWTVPMNPPKRKEDTAFEHKYNLLKYKKDTDEEGNEIPEGFARYSTRMGGIVFLYCKMLGLTKDGKAPLVPQLWTWFTRFLSMEPKPASARLLMSALEASNGILEKIFGTQWHKLRIAMLDQYVKLCPTQQPEWSASKTQLGIVLREMCKLE